METLGYLASDRTSPTLLIPDLTAKLPVIGLTSSLVLTSWIVPLPQSQAALSRNDRCSAVTDLQNALIRAGFDPGTTDGVFGGATEYAVMRFQEKNQLKNDRIVGEATATALGLDPNISCETSTNTSQNPSTGSPSPPDSSIAVISIPVRFGKVMTDGEPLNVRSGPSVDYGVISTVANGASVRFVGQPVGAWLQLVDGGWIHSDWVEFVKAETPEENSTTTENKTAETSTSTANASKAESKAEPQSTIEAKGGPANPVEVEDIRFQRVQVATGGSALNVRESADFDAKVLKQLEDGEVVVALIPTGQQNLPEWVELSSGGWVASNWLEVKETIAPQG